MSRTISEGTRSPTLQEWDMTRLRWSVESWSEEMEMSQSEPNPVVMP